MKSISSPGTGPHHCREKPPLPFPVSARIDPMPAQTQHRVTLPVSPLHDTLCVTPACDTCGDTVLQAQTSAPQHNPDTNQHRSLGEESAPDPAPASPEAPPAPRARSTRLFPVTTHGLSPGTRRCPGPLLAAPWRDPCPISATSPIPVLHPGRIPTEVHVPSVPPAPHQCRIPAASLPPAAAPAPW